MKTQPFIALLLLTIYYVAYAEEQNKIIDPLVGFWHIMPDTPSGWAEVYEFRPDGTYVFYTNTMMCSRRLISIKGVWEQNETTLRLIQKEKIHLIGGRLEKSFGSCFDEYELVEATEVRTNINPNIVEVFYFLGVEIDPRYDTILKYKITINNKSFWKFSNNPDYGK